MNKWISHPTTLFLFVLEVYISIQVDSIAVVFGFIGTIAGTSLSFFIPSVVYIKAYNRYASTYEKEKYRFVYLGSIINFIIGIGCFLLFLYSNVLSVIIM